MSNPIICFPSKEIIIDALKKHPSTEAYGTRPQIFEAVAKDLQDSNEYKAKEVRLRTMRNLANKLQGSDQAKLFLITALIVKALVESFGPQKA